MSDGVHLPHYNLSCRGIYIISHDCVFKGEFKSLLLNRWSRLIKWNSPMTGIIVIMNFSSVWLHVIIIQVTPAEINNIAER